jgi:SAM-dependent methyltransferase
VKNADLPIANPFDTQEMAAGYAISRPPVHPRVIERAYLELGRTEPFRRALDIGCGAGLSTKALHGFATHCVGLEPVASMLPWAAKTAPFADWIVGSAEALPLRDGCVDWITAAGSLNYVSLARFFPDAARVLSRDGILLVYDFSPGRESPDTPALDDWFSSFYRRYPPPPTEAQDLNPTILAKMATGFRMRARKDFEIDLTLTQSFYIDYVMTETNVAAALRRGVPRPEIASWCTETLSRFLNSGERRVRFRGYFACLCAA